jgi:phosphoglycerate dehydrogenase-like enzyme
MAADGLTIGLAYPLEEVDLQRVRRKLDELLPGRTHHVVPHDEGKPLPEHYQAYFAADDAPPGLGQHPSLKWIQACSAGADAFQSLPNVASGNVQLSTASGIHSVHIAEFALAAMINLARRTDRLWSLMAQRQWPAPREYLAGRSLRGQTVAILGYGSIGREVGRLCHALGMNLVAICARPGPHVDDGFHISPDIGDPQGKLPRAWYTTAELPSAVAGADFLVITCPLNDATRGVVNRSVFDAMKSGSSVVNVARGAIIHFDDLRQALQCNKLAGAALDVHPTEPLRPDDPVYDLPNVHITPHMSGVMNPDEYSRLLCDVYLENITRFVTGRRLLNLISA